MQKNILQHNNSGKDILGLDFAENFDRHMTYEQSQENKAKKNGNKELAEAINMICKDIFYSSGIEEESVLHKIVSRKMKKIPVDEIENFLDKFYYESSMNQNKYKNNRDLFYRVFASWEEEQNRQIWASFGLERRMKNLYYIILLSSKKFYSEGDSAEQICQKMKKPNFLDEISLKDKQTGREISLDNIDAETISNLNLCKIVEGVLYSNVSEQQICELHIMPILKTLLVRIFFSNKNQHKTLSRPLS